MSLFRFKEFVVNQENCPMKINTDGVLLGALADVDAKDTICDIGTGTGVIALMLAQRNHYALIDALDIDHHAVDAATLNFKTSLFHERLHCYQHSFTEFFELNPQKKYDLIVSNPPFFLNALKSATERKNLARHTNEIFFIDLLRLAANHLSFSGVLQLIVPVEISVFLQHLAKDYHLCISEIISVKSFEEKESFRHILKFQKQPCTTFSETNFIIYAKEKEHSLQYVAALKDFFTIF